MDAYESTRRGFLKKLGLTAGAVALATASNATSFVEKFPFPLTDEQRDFMVKYELWMDNFMEVIAARKINPDDLAANKRMMQLTDEAESWQAEVVRHMQDPNFARNYMTATERMTKAID